MQTGDILKFRGENGWLSNFAEVSVTLDTITYESVEHAYIAAKCDDMEWKKLCSSGEFNAGQLKKVSKDIDTVENWDDIKYGVMETLLYQKFTKEPFKTKLLKTGTVLIREGNFWNDKYWGYCLKTNEGENMLGKLIMEIRTKLRDNDKM